MLLSLRLDCPGPLQVSTISRLLPHLLYGAAGLALPANSLFQSEQCPGRLEARSEAHSALSLKPKQDYLFNFPNTLMKTKFQPKDTSLDPNSSLTIASFPRPPLE